MSGEKTEEPTEKKLRDAREKGEAPKSQDVNAAASIACATILLVLSSWIAGEHLRKLFDIVMERAWLARDHDETMALMFEMMREAVMMSLPYLATAVFVGFGASFAQVGVQISFEPLTPNLDKINPGSGIKRLFSVKSIVEFIKMLLKALALGAVLFTIIQGLLPLLIGTSMQRPQAIVEIAWLSIIKLMGAATVVFIILGPVDFALQVWLFRRDQKMTKDEVKREYKEQEGDPEIKNKRKQLAREIANSPMKKNVAGSSVVVTNPTHYAVALLYRPGETPLPIVVAKGHDHEAAQIRALAEQHKVPMISNPPLARALYTVPLDEPIPEALFESVAAVLRWVSMIGTVSAALAGPMHRAGANPNPSDPTG
jgi:type III secretion protein U